MIFASPAGWAVVGHGVRVAAEGAPLHFFELPIVAWRTKGEQLIPMLFEDGFYGPEWAVAGPDGKVSTGAALRFDREEYEARVIASDPLAKAELERRKALGVKVEEAV
jgi:hypothetical protein